MYTQEKPDLALYHAGVMGMKWGHRKARSTEGSSKSLDLNKWGETGVVTTKAQTAALKKSGMKMTKFSPKEEAEFWKGLAKNLSKTEKELARERRRRAVASVTKTIAAGALVGVTIGMLKTMI